MQKGGVNDKEFFWLSLGTISVVFQIDDMTEFSLDNVALQRRDSSSSNVATPPRSPTLLVSLHPSRTRTTGINPF